MDCFEVNTASLDTISPLGDYSTIPPELLEKVMSFMSPIHLVPLMLTCSPMNTLAQNERIWDKIYKRVMPETHRALHLAPNPDYWKFRNASSIKFLYEYSKHPAASQPLDTESVNDMSEVTTAMGVMKSLPMSPLVQRASVYVLRRLAYYPQVCDKKYREKIEEFRSALGREGAIESATAVLKHFDDSDVLAGALCAIGNLVIDPDNAQRLCDIGGIDIALRAMHRHPQSFPVLDYGCFALCNLGDDYKFKELVVKSGAAQFALTSLREPSFCAEELTPPLDLLSVLCQVPECKTKHGHQIIDTVDAIMPVAMSSAKLMAHTLTLTVIACENVDDTRDYAVEKAFIDKMFEAMMKFGKESLILIKSSLVLFTLFWRNDRPPMVLQRHRLIRNIVNAMKEHKADTSLQRTSAAMLSDFAHSDSGLKGLIIELGGKELVREALKVARADDSDPEWAALSAYISIDD